MIDVLFPEPQFRTRKDAGQTYIFDALRKMWLVLTPEEWVRQNFVSYLQQTLHYPKSQIAIEKELKLQDLKKRFDLLVYDRGHQPWMLVECKAPEVSLSETVLQQVLRYNISVPVPYLVITNGNHTMGWKKEAGQLLALNALPAWT